MRHPCPHALQVHYRACPTDQLLPWSVSVGQAMFINSLKVCICRRQVCEAMLPCLDGLIILVNSDPSVCLSTSDPTVYMAV